VVADHELHHPLRLPHGAELVVVGVTVLLEEVLLDEGGNIQGDLVRVRQGTLSDKLHDLVQLLGIGQQLLDALSESGEFGVLLLVILVQDVGVLAVRQTGVDRREVLSLGELLVETPEHLDDTESGRGDGIGEITTGRADGTDDAHTAVTLRRSEGLDASSALVEGGELGTEVSGETLVSRHLSETTRKLTKSLSPTGGRVSHHGDVETLVTEVLGNSDTGVDGGLTGCDGHVGGVGDEGRSLHDGLLSAIDIDRELGEILQDFSHLVSSLTAADVDNDIGVGELGDGLTNDSLAASEGTRDSNSTTLNTGKEGVEHPLADNEGLVRGQLLGRGSGNSHGPGLEHGVVRLLALELDLEQVLGDSVLALGGNLGDDTAGAGREEDAVRRDEGVLEDCAPNITAGDVIANLQRRGELPLLLAVNGRDGDAARDVDRAGDLGDVLQGSLDTVVDTVEETGSELDGERLSSSGDGVTDLDTGCLRSVLSDLWACVGSLVGWGEGRTGLFVNLDGCLIGVDSNDLTHEVVVSDFDLHQAVSIEEQQLLPASCLHTSSYMATPIMSSATTTGLCVSD
jgi:hypothetical protein